MKLRASQIAVLELQRKLAAYFVAHRSQLVKIGFINGLPGFVTIESVAMYLVRNPDKLRHLAAGGPS